jgi:hypothetical protein
MKNKNIRIIIKPHTHNIAFRFYLEKPFSESPNNMQTNSELHYAPLYGCHGRYFESRPTNKPNTLWPTHNSTWLVSIHNCPLVRIVIGQPPCLSHTWHRNTSVVFWEVVVLSSLGYVSPSTLDETTRFVINSRSFPLSIKTILLPCPKIADMMGEDVALVSTVSVQE